MWVCKKHPLINMDKIFKCDTCGEIIPEDELKIVIRKGSYEEDYGIYFPGYSSHEYTEEKKVCPICRCDEFTEGYICDKCGNFVKMLADDDLHICYDCYEEE